MYKIYGWYTVCCKICDLCDVFCSVSGNTIRNPYPKKKVRVES